MSDNEEIDDATRERFIRDLRARGEVVSEGDDLPPGATHEVEEDPDNKKDGPQLHRKRFSAY